MGNAAKFRLLIWKNWLLHLRHPIQTILEIFLPVLFAVFLVMIRIGGDIEKHDNVTIYEPFEAINTSLLAFANREYIAWSPTHPELDKIMKKAVAMLELNDESYVNEEELIKELTSSNHSAIQRTLLGVIFDDDLATKNTIQPQKLKIIFRYPAETYFVTHPSYNWKTNTLFPSFYTQDPRFGDYEKGGPPTGYYWHGFIAVQDAISRSLLEYFTQTEPPVSVQLMRFPYPKYTNDPLQETLKQITAFMIMLSFAYTAMNIVKMITKEKENQLKETMKIMGLPNWIHWLACFLTLYTVLVLSIALFVVVVKLKVNQDSKVAIFTYSDGTLLFVFMLLYAISIICFCFMISAFFSKANTATLATAFAWFLLYTPYFYVEQEYERLSTFVKVISCLALNTAMSCGIRFFVLLEGRGVGAQWKDLFTSLNEDDGFVLAHVMIMFIVDAILYFLITLYVETVCPGTYGTPKSCCFFLQKSFWFDVTTNIERRQSLTIQKIPATAEYEKEPTNLPVGIQIRNLSKKYGSIVAVDKMTFNLYEGQITVLLGHNGAGKTTTMAMLTGMLRPTSGTAIVGGYNICTASAGARKSLGLCPQQNILFDELTVREHLYFFGKLKGMNEVQVQEDITKYIEVLEFESKEHSRASALSGGMKRKLSASIAMCGDSKVVVFDEPSAGLDPSARRALWDMLEMEKQTRTILLSTHMMDEADLLGDRIAIIAGGRLQCCGSPFFLKKKYGAGYNLVIVKDQGCNVADVTNLVQRHIPGISPPLVAGSDLSYRVNESESGKFEAMLSDLENSKKNLRIVSYGVSLTTMEEVFMKVRRGEELGGSKMDEKKLHASTGSGTTFCLIISKGPLCHVTGVTELLRTHIPTIKMTYNSYSDLKYTLDSTEKEKFKEMLKELEQKKYNLDVKSYYMKFNLRQGDKELEEFLKRRHSTEYIPFTDSEKGLLLEEEVKILTGGTLCWHRIYAMILKKATYINRTFNFYLILVLLLMIFLFIILLLTMVWATEDLPALEIGLEKYLNPHTMVALQKDSSEDANKIYSQYKSLITNGDVMDVGTDSEDVIQTMADAITSKTRNQLPYFRRHYIVAATFNLNSSNQIIATGWFNNLPYHTIPLTMSLIYNAIFSAYVTDASLDIVNYPLPYSATSKAQSEAKDFHISIELVFTIGFTMAFLSAFFVLFHVKELESRSKLLQILAGVSEFTYWMTSLLWDFFVFLLPVIAILLLLLVFQEAGFNTFEELGRLTVILLCFGWAMLPLMYLISLCVTTPTTGLVRAAAFNLFAGIAAFLVLHILTLPQFDSADAAGIIEWFFLIVPHYSLCSSLYKLHSRHVYVNSCPQQLKFCYVWGFRSQCCFDYCDAENCEMVEEEYFAWDSPGIGREILFLLVSGLIYFLILLLFNLRHMFLWTKNIIPHSSKTSKTTEQVEEEIDNDVQQEIDKIHNEDITELLEKYSILLKDVSKYYGPFEAVKQICLTVEEGECFGLLGENGAGKTTTFKMLTGDANISKGEAYIEKINMRTKRQEVGQKIGYCPQFDAVLEDLTGRESLTLFCMLRGISTSQCTDVVNLLADELLISEYLDKKVYTYSGGNKRKLSTAIALVGEPPIILLDEPTTSMDPVAKRQLWNVICKVRDKGKSIILTSHSMEECEALCTKVAIMVNGSFKCLGSIQHLKNKFAKGSILNVQVKKKSRKKRRLSITEGEMAPVKKYVVSNIKGAVLREEYLGVLTFYIPHQEDLKWPALFAIMETAKKNLNIEDYSLAQTNLDQVFLSFTKYQK